MQLTGATGTPAAEPHILMTGYLVTFFTQENRTHGGTSLAEWILEQARQLGIQGATMMSATAGFGHDGRFHSESYFDLEDRPQQVVMALRTDKCADLFARLKENGLHVFYTKAPIEFGFTDD